MKRCTSLIGFIILMLCCQMANAQERKNKEGSISEAVDNSFSKPGVKTEKPVKEKSQKKENDVHKKRFFFTAAFDPNFTHTAPPIYTYFEYGIANLASAGLSLGVSYDKTEMPNYKIETGFLAVGPRVMVYPLAILSKINGEEIGAGGFEPHIGLVYDYVVIKRQVDDGDDESFTDSQFGASFGTRWYPGNKNRFALFAEYNTNGIGYSQFKVDYADMTKKSGGFRVGITLGR